MVPSRNRLLSVGANDCLVAQPERIAANVSLRVIHYVLTCVVMSCGVKDENSDEGSQQIDVRSMEAPRVKIISPCSRCGIVLPHSEDESPKPKTGCIRCRRRRIRNLAFLSTGGSLIAVVFAAPTLRHDNLNQILDIGFCWEDPTALLMTAERDG